MSHRIISGSVLAATFALACVLVCGCAKKEPPPEPVASAPPASLAQIKQELITAKAQLDTTTAAMNTLAQSSPTDVNSNYDKFAAEQAKLQSAADTCRSRANDLKMRTQAYYDAWNKQADVQNPELRRSAAVQRAGAESTFNTIRNEIELTRLSFEPYMSQLEDINSYLEKNKSPAALATVSGIAAKATADAGEVNKHLDAVLGGINQIMTAEGTAMPAAAGSPTPPAR